MFLRVLIVFHENVRAFYWNKETVPAWSREILFHIARTLLQTSRFNIRNAALEAFYFGMNRGKNSPRKSHFDANAIHYVENTFERRATTRQRISMARVFTLRKTKRCVVSFFWQTNYTPFHSVAENVFVQLAQKMIAGERNRFLKTKFIFTVYTTNER